MLLLAILEHNRRVSGRPTSLQIYRAVWNILPTTARSMDAGCVQCISMLLESALRYHLTLITPLVSLPDGSTGPNNPFWVFLVLVWYVSSKIRRIKNIHTIRIVLRQWYNSHLGFLQCKIGGHSYAGWSILLITESKLSNWLDFFQYKSQVKYESYCAQVLTNLRNTCIYSSSFGIIWNTISFHASKLSITNSLPVPK